MSTPGRLSGLLLPLFSLRSQTDFGIGDFGALEGLFSWMKAARQRMLMVLPLLPTAPGDPSPYATRSAFGLNPLFIDLQRLPEFTAAGGEAALSDAQRAQLTEARSAPRVRYDLVFPLKDAAFARAFDVFEAQHWAPQSERAKAFRQWRDAQGEWLESYALFTAISEQEDRRPWWEWPEPLRTRQPEALAQKSRELERRVRYHAWLQWVAEQQWNEVRTQARAQDVLLCGDEPFIIGQDSADVWAHPDILRRDARLGVPPDDFSATGQDWGLPYFDLAAMEKDDFAWLKMRAKKAASYYDLRRVDHAVGYFRQWIRDAQTPTGRFIPPDEESHRRLGEKTFRLLSEGAGIVAEDLGVIPPFVRHILAELKLPGYRVMRWERDDNHYRDPRQFPAVSLVTTGTHDTDTVAEWWEGAGDHERQAAARSWPELNGVAITREFTPDVHRAMLASALNANSDLCVLPWQDVLGTRDRINLPGSMSDSNWAYRIEQNVSDLLTDSRTREAAERLAWLTASARR
ncbi:4-alpha-glucanotransferase [Myxococcus xanthus]|uniref:4-alpha-glucanotransferase n=1 Tax=Myxococcus xanthus TaxID=34 RepID=A0AAE6KVA8_MYXXA|nr:4-alpha-glucanotransferase [Myxococcus xanthus]QDE71317.1 4-alpha-glucanotransferase [Myxococcus xanthus]QDE78597.1 4-alpha-glucanotransferase [Myxococcus xanthus]